MLQTILDRVTADPVGLLLTAVFVGAGWSLIEWGIKRADASKIGRPE